MLRRTVERLQTIKKRSLLRWLLYMIRFVQLETAVCLVSVNRLLSNRIWLFSLNAHVSVIADLEVELRRHPRCKVVVWNVSNHNFVFRRIFREPDPVRFLGPRVWPDLSASRRRNFLSKYGKFLRNFDGFIVTHPISFVQLFLDLQKPVLAVAATRFEYPHTAFPRRWDDLVAYLRKGLHQNLLTLVANNAGDADYVGKFVQRPIQVVPSVCDYIDNTGAGEPFRYPIFAKSEALTKILKSELGAPWDARERALGRAHTWAKIRECAAVIYIPFNTSTMTLFEFATLGIPVLIPDRSLLKQLARDHDGVLSELLFPGLGLPQGSSGLGRWPATNPEHADHIDWWLDRADFYNSELMPNVLTFTSTTDDVFQTDFEDYRLQLQDKVFERNSLMIKQRQFLIDQFLDSADKIREKTRANFLTQK